MEEKFVLKEISKSEIYGQYNDVLRVVLDEDKEYTIEEIEKALNEFLDKEV